MGCVHIPTIAYLVHWFQDISRHFDLLISIHRLALGNLAIQIDTEMAGDDYIKRFDEIGYITF